MNIYDLWLNDEQKNTHLKTSFKAKSDSCTSLLNGWRACVHGCVHVCVLWRVVLVFLEMRDIALAVQGNVTTQ